MPPITHEIAPKGDTILVVNNPNAPFAPWPKTSDRTSEESGEPKCNPEVRIRVSSAHLKLASPYFDRALFGDWKEATVLRETGSVEIETSDWGVEALLLLLRIFHCQLSDLPKTITLELLANLCTLIDYYESHSILGFVSERWYQSQYMVTSLGNTSLVPLMSNGTSEVTLIQIERLIDQRQMMLFLWVTWVFNKPNAFLACSSFLISTIDGPLTSLGLPLPSTITDQINERREKLVGDAIHAIRSQESIWDRDGTSCGKICDFVCLGTLRDFIAAKGLSPAYAPFESFSLRDLQKSVRSLKVPKWREWTEERPTTQRPHACTNTTFTELSVKLFSMPATGLKLEDFKPRPNGSKPGITLN